MKRTSVLKLAVCAMAFIMTLSAKSQSVKGANYVNAGIGVGTFGFYGSGLPITASFEHGVTDNISVGATLGYVQTKYIDWKYQYYVIGARGSYHFNDVLNVTNPKLDVYGGLALFYRHYSVKDISGAGAEYPTSASAGNIGLGIHVGSRYMFNPNVGGFAELGYGISPLQLGVAFKF